MAEEMQVALYLRLSLEDKGCGDESNSISNQRILLNFFAAEIFKNERYRISEFVDDGYSGTGFERPAIRKLLDLAGGGKIDCIIVKDFSRFSRDYIEMGSYLEQIFPFWGIRFISVNDRYDSHEYAGRLPQLNTVFQYLINDLYAKDISIKVKSSLDAKKEKGIYANGSTPFGYQKSPKDPHQLTPVEPEAGIVRRIFQMTADGFSSSRIARQLNAEGVKTPIEHKMARGLMTVKPKGKKFIWDESVICQMLRNDFYAGDLVYGKYETETVGGKPRLKPRAEWKIYKNHHEAIIDRKMYEVIQKSRGSVKNPVKRKKHPLTGKIICGCCLKALKTEYTLNPYFFCPTRYKTDSPECVTQINVMFAEQAVLYLLHQEIMKQADRKEMRQFYGKILRKKQKEIQYEKELMAGEKKRLQREKCRIYEQYRKNKINRNQYMEIQKRLQMEEKRILDAAAEKEEKLGKAEDDLADAAKNIGNVWRKCNIMELNQEAADVFVDRIKVWDEKHMEIIWNFNDGGVLQPPNT